MSLIVAVKKYIYQKETVKNLNRSKNIITTNTEYTIDPQRNIEEQYAKIKNICPRCMPRKVI